MAALRIKILALLTWTELLLKNPLIQSDRESVNRLEIRRNALETLYLQEVGYAL